MNDKLKNEVIASFVKQGPWAVSFLAICIVFYCVAIKPMSEERSMLVDTLRETNLTLAESTVAMADSIERMEINLLRFTDQVTHNDHPKQTRMLERLCEDLKELQEKQ